MAVPSRRDLPGALKSSIVALRTRGSGSWPKVATQKVSQIPQLHLTAAMATVKGLLSLRLLDLITAPNNCTGL